MIAIDGRFAAGVRRGIGKGSLELLRAILAQDSELYYEILVDREPAPGLLEPGHGWSWRRLSPGLYPVWEQLRLPAYVRRRRPAVLHSVGNTAPLRLPRTGTKLVVTVHDLIFLESWPLSSLRQRLGRIYRRLVVPAAVRRADWVITDAIAVRDQLVARFPMVANRISVIGIPVGQHFFDYRPGPSAASPPYLMAFATIDPRKNLPRILAAFAQARKAVPAAEMLLVGSQGAPLPEPSAGIRSMSYVPEAQLLSLLAGSRGLVYVSLSEGFGVPILEAMALGVPVVTSNREPMKELAAGAALLVEPLEVAAISDAMVRLLTDDEERQRLAMAGRARAQDFQPVALAREMIALYARLIE